MDKYKEVEGQIETLKQESSVIEKKLLESTNFTLIGQLKEERKKVLVKISTLEWALTIMEDKKIRGYSIQELDEGSWGTIAGEQKTYRNITHQHWSNIYWYHKYLSNKLEKELIEGKKEIENLRPENVGTVWVELLKDMLKGRKIKLERVAEVSNFSLAQLEYRFDGKILDWQPQYENEKKWYREQCTRKILIEKYK